MCSFRDARRGRRGPTTGRRRHRRGRGRRGPSWDPSSGFQGTSAAHGPRRRRVADGGQAPAPRRALPALPKELDRAHAVCHHQKSPHDRREGHAGESTPRAMASSQQIRARGSSARAGCNTRSCRMQERSGTRSARTNRSGPPVSGTCRGSHQTAEDPSLDGVDRATAAGRGGILLAALAVTIPVAVEL